MDFNFLPEQEIIEVFNYRKNKVNELNELKEVFKELNVEHSTGSEIVKECINLKLREVLKQVIDLESEILHLSHILLYKYIDIDSFTISSDFYDSYEKVCKEHNFFFLVKDVHNFYKANLEKDLVRYR